MGRYQNRIVRKSLEFQLPQYGERKPAGTADVGRSAADAGVDIFGEWSDVLPYTADVRFLERPRDLFDRIGGYLELQGGAPLTPPAEFMDDPMAQEYLDSASMPRMDFEAVIRKLPQERIQLLTRQVRQEHPTGRIEALMVKKTGDAILEKMALSVTVDGALSGDHVVLAKPLVLQAYGLLKRDFDRTGAMSGRYTVYDPI